MYKSSRRNKFGQRASQTDKLKEQRAKPRQFLRTISCLCWQGGACMGQGNRPGRAGMGFKELKLLHTHLEC